jgi:hypothetical protein
MQHAGQKGERHDWQVVHNGVWESVYKCDKCGKTVTENTDGQDKPIFGCAAPQPAVPDEKKRYSDSPYEGGYADGWNACRKALLSAGMEKNT